MVRKCDGFTPYRKLKTLLTKLITRVERRNQSFWLESATPPDKTSSPVTMLSSIFCTNFVGCPEPNTHVNSPRNQYSLNVDDYYWPRAWLETESDFTLDVCRSETQTEVWGEAAWALYWRVSPIVHDRHYEMVISKSVQSGSFADTLLAWRLTLDLSVSLTLHHSHSLHLIYQSFVTVYLNHNTTWCVSSLALVSRGITVAVERAHELSRFWKQYLKDRKQCVEYTDSKSIQHRYSREVWEKGVHQGSILGPLLFITNIKGWSMLFWYEAVQPVLPKNKNKTSKLKKN